MTPKLEIQQSVRLLLIKQKHVRSARLMRLEDRTPTTTNQQTAPARTLALTTLDAKCQNDPKDFFATTTVLLYSSRAIN